MIPRGGVKMGEIQGVLRLLDSVDLSLKEREGVGKILMKISEKMLRGEDCSPYLRALRRIAWRAPLRFNVIEGV